MSINKQNMVIIIQDKIIKKTIELLDLILRKRKLNLIIKLKKYLLAINSKVIFIVEGKKWAIYWVGAYITKNLNKLNLIKSAISSPKLISNKIIHFGSINCLFPPEGLKLTRKKNKIILTWFHIDPSDKRIKYIPIINNKVDLIVTSSQITKNKLIEYGASKDKIVIIPLGVDLNYFKRYDKKKVDELKEKYKIPKDKIIIGSFQKDGAGWGEGLEPKYVKGPDIFCEVVRKLNQKYNVHVFLTGPARGFVKKTLEDYNIPYTHKILENYLEIVECYNILDLYIITSRAEGGPIAMLESLATGVPLITTRVGMAEQVIKNNINGIIADIDDVNDICNKAIRIINDDNLRNEIIENGLKIIHEYSWENIAKQYYKNVYKRFEKYLN